MNGTVDYFELAVDTTLAVMASASTDKIPPKHWWERARSALEVAADYADTWPTFASKMADKLCIDTYSARSAEALKALEGQVDHLPSFFTCIRKDAAYIVAMAAIKRSEQRKRNDR